MSEDYRSIFEWVQSAANSKSTPGLPGGNVSSQQINSLISKLNSIKDGTSEVSVYSTRLDTDNVITVSTSILALNFNLKKNSYVKFEFSASGVADSDATSAKFELINSFDKKTIIRTGCFSSSNQNIACASFVCVVSLVAGDQSFSINAESDFNFNIPASVANNASWAHGSLVATIFG